MLSYYLSGYVLQWSPNRAIPVTNDIYILEQTEKMQNKAGRGASTRGGLWRAGLEPPMSPHVF